MAGGSIRAQLRLEGGKAFAEDFKNAASAVKSANAEVNYFTTALNKNSNSQEALAGKSKALQSAFDAEQKIIDSLTRRIEELSNTTGQDTTQAVNELTAELYKHKTAQAQLGDQVDDTTEDFKELGTQAGTTAALVSKAWDLAVTVGKKLWDIGKDAVMYNAQMESYSATISAFFRTSGQSAEEAAANTEALIQAQKELSSATGMSTDKLIDANKMLIASGVSGDKSQKAISALAKAIVATGGGNEELSRMASNLQQISNTGKASTQDMKQFAMAGVDVYGLMADTTGKTVEELKEMDITFDMIVDALDNATQEGGKFFEASQVGASTLQGKMNTLQSTIKDKLGTAFEPFSDALSNEILPQVQELVENIDWEALGEMMADAAKFATDAFGILVSTLDELAHVYGIVKDAVKDWGNVGTRVANDVKNGYIGTAGAFKKAYDEQNKVAEGSKTVSYSFRTASDQVAAAAAEIPNSISAQGPRIASAASSAGSAAASAYNKEFKYLYNDSYTWGTHAGSGFADGINAQVPVIATAAARAAGAVRSYMAFTRPDKGPLHEYEEWMPHMMQGFAKGIDDNLWRIQDASREVAATIAAPTMVTTLNGGISMTVNAAPGQSASQIADEVMNRIQHATQRRVAVWA